MQEKTKPPIFLQAGFYFLAIIFALTSVRNNAAKTLADESNRQTPQDALTDSFVRNSVFCYYESKASNSLHKFQVQKEPREIVFLGSSLMLYPFWEMDRASGIRVSEIGYYPYAKSVENALAGAGVSNTSIFNWATLLQMNSDSLLITKQYLLSPSPPKLVVLGLAPRDFYDNLITSPSATTYFQQYAFWPLWFDKAYVNSVEYFAQAILTKNCALYSDKGWIQSLVTSEFRKAIFALFKLQPLPPRFQSFYVPRYKNIQIDKMTEQSRFLQKLIETCAERKIKLLLINMPLSASNRRLLPEGVYQQFNQNLATLAAANRLPLLDLSSSAQFTEKDYIDGVHLNRYGGAKLVKELLPLICHELALGK